jgi:hypothetical protein
MRRPPEMERFFGLMARFNQLGAMLPKEDELQLLIETDSKEARARAEFAELLLREMEQVHDAMNRLLEKAARSRDLQVQPLPPLRKKRSP